ncbi:OmpH family outer membrane protein [Verrucomicrobiaceae bacterium 227]
MKFSLLSRSIRTFPALLLSFSLAISSASAELKVAMVDMTTLLNNYHKTKTAELEDKVNRDAIKKGDIARATEMQAKGEELRKLGVDFRDPQLSPEKRKAIAAEAKGMQETLEILKKEREEYLERSSRALNEKMVGLMDEIRTEVIEAVNKHAEGAEVDYVFDESGLTTTQVPFIVYVRNRVDITADVLKLLNKDAPDTSPAATPAKGE